jgi:hypothetical protein
MAARDDIPHFDPKVQLAGVLQVVRDVLLEATPWAYDLDDAIVAEHLIAAESDIRSALQRLRDEQ